MLIRNTYTEAKRASSGSSTNKIDLGTGDDAGYEGLIITSTLTGVVTAYMVSEDDIVDNGPLPYTTGLEFPASTAAGTYFLKIGAIKCATGADAAKVIVFR